MSNIASIILVSIYLCIKGLRAQTDAAYPRCDAVPRVQNALEKYGLKLDAVLLLGHVPSRAERVAASRALAELETRGFIRRVRSRRSGRTIRVRITSLGEVAAEQILATPSGEVVFLTAGWDQDITEEGCNDKANDEC